MSSCGNAANTFPRNVCLPHRLAVKLCSFVASLRYYCRPNRHDEGIVFLAEAALGRQFDLPRELIHSAPGFRSAPLGFESVVTDSLSAPDPAENVKIALDGRDVTLATGAPVMIADDGDKVPHFIQREYLVYKEEQVRLRYLVQLKM